MKRRWKPVVGYENSYKVSNDGMVKSTINGKVLKQIDSHGYRFVNLRKQGKTRCVAVHRLVCTTFNGKPEDESMQVDHLNMLRSDNRPENLEWVTAQENQRRKVAAKKGIRGIADDGSIVILPNLMSADIHGFDSSLVMRCMARGLPYLGYMWESIG